VVVDNLSSGKLEHVQEIAANRRFRLIIGDLLDPALLDEPMKNADTVYHFAANPDVRFRMGEATDKDLKQNVLVTYNVLESMRRHDVQRMVFSSTSAVYGLSDGLPIPEERATRPISLYGATKASCEALISAFSHLFGIQAWIFRFANIVGSRTRSIGRTVISDFIDKLLVNPKELLILGDGRQTKSYLLASECVEGMLFAVEHSKQPLNIYNLGCHDSIPVTRIAEMVVAAMGLHSVRFEYTGGEGGWAGDVPKFVLDVSAINRLGWKAKHSSEVAVRLAIDAVLSELAHCEQTK
jgi:UDP-glucose 4-epimerase